MYRYFWEGGPGGKSSIPNPGLGGEGRAGVCQESSGACCEAEGMENEAGPTQRDQEKPSTGLPGWQFALQEERLEG